VPISALTIAESGPLVYLVFAHTRLRGPDFDATAATLVFFSLGMFAWGAQNILARGFYATRNTLIPAIVGTALALANLPVYWALSRSAQHIGLAIASSIGITAYTFVLFLLLNRRTHNREAGAITSFFFKVCAASAAVAWVCHRLQLYLEPHFAWHAIRGAFALLVIVSSVGIILLFIAAKLLGIREFDELIVRVRGMLSRSEADAVLPVAPRDL
jgi:putative peptidoglycan lipid II flippase